MRSCPGLQGGPVETLAARKDPMIEASADAEFRSYVGGGLSRVAGWLNPFSAAFIGSISKFQREGGLSGSVGEIGVHHGKLFILLHTLSDPDKPSFAIDLFEDQHLNVDGSGKGDYSQFRKNLARWSSAPDRIEIFQGSSLELDPANVIAACGRSRLMSVDGGHTEACTRNDLQIGEAVSEPYGVVVIDDYFNEFFPEVSVGVHTYLAKGRLRPFAITPGKLYLADPAFTDGYRRWLRERWAKRFEKTCVMLDSEVDLFGVRYSSYPIWKRALRDSPFFPQLERLKRDVQAKAGSESIFPGSR